MNRHQPKAVLCLDIDGTLTDTQENIHPRDIAILQDFPEQIRLILTTGRILHSALGVLQENGLFTKGRFPLPGVFMNGGVALLPGEQRIVEHPLVPALLADLTALPAAFPDTTFAFFGPAEVSLVSPTPFGRQVAERHYFHAEEVPPAEVPEKIVKVMAINQDQTALESIKARTLNWPAEMGYTLPYLYEFNAPGINKAATLRVLLGRLGLTDLPVFAAGDGENDLPLIPLTERFFAPGTANATVRQRADEIIDRQRDGILAPALAVIQAQLD